MIWIHTFFFYQISRSVRQNPCLAGTGSRQYQHRSFRLKNRFLLLCIQQIIFVHAASHLTFRHAHLFL